MPASSVAPGAPATAEPSFAEGVRIDAPNARHGEASRGTHWPTPRPDPLRIELSILADARVGDGQTALGIGAVSFADVGGWLAGFEGRADRYQERGGGPAGGALELSVLCGRRFRLQNLAVDLSAGPAVALRGAVNTTTVTPMGTSTSKSSERFVPRALLGARLNFSAHSILRTFLGLEGEFGPAGASGERPSDAPVRPGLPVWTVGLALGATVGTP
jgi:hypothetical protein